MAEYDSQPDKDVVEGWWAQRMEQHPTNPGTFLHFTLIDEGFAFKNTSDYWRALEAPPTLPTRHEHFGYPADAPDDLLTGDQIRYLIFFKSTKIRTIPGMLVKLYWDKTIVTATGGTNSTNIFVTGGEFAGIGTDDFVKNLTRTEEARVLSVPSSNQIVTTQAIPGQIAGDQIEVIELKVTKLFHIDTSGLWESFVLIMTGTALGLTKTQLNEMETRVSSVVGAGGEIPGNP